MANEKPKRILYVLSSDPGTANHGSAVSKAELVGGRLKFELLGNTMIDREFLPQDFSAPYEAQALYLKALDKFFRSCVPKHVRHPSLVVMERFQARGIRGSQGEIVSFMLGSQVAKYGSNAPVVILTAGTWKNQVNRMKVSGSKKPLDVLYEKNKAAGGVNHTLDACLMASYGAAKTFGIPYFTNLASSGSRLKFLGEVKRTSK